MANSIDWGTLALGTLIGVGCREQLRAASKVAATTAASLASSAAIAVNSVAAQMYDDQTKTESVGQAGQGTQGQAGTQSNGTV